MASTDNYGYGNRSNRSSTSNYRSYNDEGYNWRIEEALRRAAEARMRRAQNNAGQRSGSYYQYQSQSNDRRGFRSPTETRVGAGTLGNNGVSEQELSKWMNKGYAPQSWRTGNAWQRAAARNIALANNNKVNYRDMLINKSAKESTPVLIKNLGDKMIGVADKMQETRNQNDQIWRQAIAPYQGHNPTANTPGMFQGYSNYTPMGTPMTTQTGGIFGSYGAGLSAGDYARMTGDYRSRLLDRASDSIVRNQSYGPIGVSYAPREYGPPSLTPVSEDTYNDYLDELRYASRGGGMASQGYTGVNTYMPPETLPDQTPPGGGGYNDTMPYYEPGYGYDDWGGWGGGGGYYGGGGGYYGGGGNTRVNYNTEYNNNYRGGGGMSRANDINKWYANMVQWNIGKARGA